MKTIVMILAGGKGERLYPLTRDRAKPAVPFGGIYRIIDFTLSNCVHSNLKKIFILTQYRSLSLEKHIQHGWNILCSKIGEYIQLVSAQQRIDESWYLGTADAIYQNLYILQSERPELVLILSGDHLYKMDYSSLIEYHKAKGADLTVATIEQEAYMSRHFGVMQVDQDFRIIGFEEKPARPATIPGDPTKILASMGIYVFTTEILVRRLIEDAKKQTKHDFGKDIIPSMVPRDLVYAYPFRDKRTERPAYWKDLGNIQAYWEAHKDLLGETPVFDLYDAEWPILTHEPSAPPARILPGGSGHIITDSIISNGCVINAESIERSVLSPNVVVGRGVRIEDSIILEGVVIEDGTKVRRTIIDKGTTIPSSFEIGYDLKKDKRNFTVTDSGIVVVTRETKLV